MRKLAALFALIFLCMAASASASVTDPQFSFGTDGQGATYQCAIDGGAASSCSSPKDFGTLAPGQHTVTITETITVPQPAKAAPTAAFSFMPANPVTGQKVTFDGSASTCDPADSCTYYYHDITSNGAGDWPLIGPGSANSGSFTFQHTGTKYVELVVTDTSTGKVATVEHNVVVGVPTVAAPTNTTAPAISGTPQQGGVLTASQGSWTGSPTSFAYRWQRCSPSCGNIAGATGATYTAQSADVGDTLDVIVTATNAGGSASATSAQTLPVSASTGGEGGSCDLNATPANFASQVSAAQTGQTVCLASGNYGTWTGTSKAITIAPQGGASPVLNFSFGSGAQNFTIDGGIANYDTNSPGIQLTGVFDVGSKNITIENFASSCNGNGAFCIDVLSQGPGILITHGVFHDMLYPNTATAAVGVRQSIGDVPASNIQVNYNLFRDIGADGIQFLGSGEGTAIGNDFSDVTGANQSDPRHTDAIQLYGGWRDVLEGNFVYNGCTQGIGGFDGTGSNTIEDNIVVGCTVHSLYAFADNPASTVDHNTVVGAGRASFECGSKAGDPVGVTNIRDNILEDGVDTSGTNGGPACQPTTNTHNIGVTGVVFTGGANPSTYAGYALASGSAGQGGATDGTDIGARPGNYPRPPGLP